MNKIAIFVEGLTERKFAKRLIYQRYAHINPVIVREMVLKGKGSYFEPINVNHIVGIDYLFLIVEVPDYSRLLTTIIDNAENMFGKKGFVFILGLRDLIPNKRSEKGAVISAIRNALACIPLGERIGIVLAVMETEAWFLYNWQMFQRIDTKLCPSLINQELHVDLVNDDPETRYDRPAKVINDILHLAGLRYRKHEGEIDTIVHNIDFNHMFSCSDRVDSFRRFVGILDRCCSLTGQR